MQFTVFTSVASFLALVVANPAPISNTLESDLEPRACSNTNEWCIRRSTNQRKACCGNLVCQAIPFGDVLYCG